MVQRNVWRLHDRAAALGRVNADDVKVAVDDVRHGLLLLLLLSHHAIV